MKLVQLSYSVRGLPLTIYRFGITFQTHLFRWVTQSAGMTTPRITSWL